MKKRISLCLLLLAPLLGCETGRADPPQETAPETVAVIQPQRADVVRSITLPGDLVGFYEAALHAKVSGYLKSVNVDKGDTVKQGQVLAEIEVKVKELLGMKPAAGPAEEEGALEE